MKLLSKAKFLATFASPMQRVPLDAEPPFEFWDYFEQIPPEDFEAHDCSNGAVSYAYNDATGRYQQVLVSSEHKNIFMVLVLDLKSQSVMGHRLMDLNKEYGLDESENELGHREGNC